MVCVKCQQSGYLRAWYRNQCHHAREVWWCTWFTCIKALWFTTAVLNCQRANGSNMLSQWPVLHHPQSLNWGNHCQPLACVTVAFDNDAIDLFFCMHSVVDVVGCMSWKSFWTEIKECPKPQRFWGSGPFSQGVGFLIHIRFKATHYCIA